MGRKWEVTVTITENIKSDKNFSYRAGLEMISLTKTPRETPGPLTGQQG